MAVKIYKPTTNGRRNMTAPSFEEITKSTPEKKLTVTLKKHAGRNSYGRITVRHHGGGNKKKYRIIDFKRQTEGKGTVIGVEYDPNRSAYIALVEYENGERSYILAPVGLTDGDVVESGENADIKAGNTLPVANIPVGSMINNIELYPGKAVSSSARQALRRSSWRRKTVRRRSVCPPANTAMLRLAARRRSVRSATSSMTLSRSVKRARRDTAASARRYAVRS